MRRLSLVALIALLIVGAVAFGSRPAAARPWRDDYVRIGQAHVLRVGSPAAGQVLVLLPGTFGAAGDFRGLAGVLARQLPDTQVWAMDLRQTNLEDLSGFSGGDPDRAAAYYLGDHYRTPNKQATAQAAGWGLATTLNDVRQVVLAAREGGHRRVVLGGHSWGATTALAYAGWDFAGHAGYRDLSGLVLIDGGMHDAFAGEGDVYRVTPEQAEARLQRIADGEVFDPSLTMGRTETFAIMQQLAGQYAQHAPDAPSTLAAALPAPLRPTGPVTNAGLLNWLYVEHPLVADLSVNPAYTSTAALADALAGPVPAGYEWYWPDRLSLDLSAADPYRRTATTDLLRLRLWHTTEVDVPLYSFQTGLTHGTVNTAAQWVVAHSRIPSASYAGDAQMTHLDAVFADPDRNPLVPSLGGFLDRLDARARR